MLAVKVINKAIITKKKKEKNKLFQLKDEKIFVSGVAREASDFRCAGVQASPKILSQARTEKIFLLFFSLLSPLSTLN